MSDQHDRRDDDLARRLRNHESRILVSVEPDLASGEHRSWPWLTVAAITAGLAVVLAVAVPRLMQPVAIEPIPTASASSPIPTTPISPAPTPPTPTPRVTPTPEPTLAPRAEWSAVSGDAFRDVDRLDGVAEARGRLFVLGSDKEVQPMIWFSIDGETWQPAVVEAVPTRYGGQFKALVDAGDRLVAVATLGFAEGSRYFATMIYTSEDDGETWRPAKTTPGLTAAAMFDVTVAGSRVVAVGSSVWTSDDGGLNWMATIGNDSLGGTIRDVDGDESLLLAAGMIGTDIANPPALAWISRDQGASWRRTVLDRNAGATGALVTSSGELMVSGYDASSSERSIVWSAANDKTWSEQDIGDVQCCSTGLVETPSGTVVGVEGGTYALSGALTSAGGEAWSLEAVSFQLREVTWTPSFGLVAITDDNGVVYGPQPYP